MDEEDLFEEAGTPLSVIAEAFEELSNSISTSSDDLLLGPLTNACSLVSVLFGYLGIAFKFAELEYVCKVCFHFFPIHRNCTRDCSQPFEDEPEDIAVYNDPDALTKLKWMIKVKTDWRHKVRDLAAASKTYDTLKNILDHDLENDTVRKPGSLSRNLRRVRQGLELIRALFEQFLSSDECSLREAASTAYAQACAPYHTWAIRTAVFAAMYALPTREQLLLKLNETDHSAEKEMRRYINASLPVIEYIDNLYISRNIGLDW
ncbi:hypothetical protein HHK36_029801 [Tetracentron sinense]|uniref:Glycolipid transfer protein domain-containing protein n=1 Tax=Tetracentron sinense TaxID=13715 RepID=A0A835D240_TETSI|nr:hypothetical protein HHK36_029801 [Tetracentron sinense]